MSKTLHKIITYFATHPRQLFLADALGALLTAILLWTWVRNFDAHFGLSPMIASGLALVALLIFLYSISCYCFIKTRWKPFLRTLASINLLYCALTLTLLCIHSCIKPLGVIYFTGELLIVGMLIFVELRVASRLKRSQRD